MEDSNEEITVYVGTAGFARPRPQYAEKLGFVEIELRAPLPATRVFAGWRKELGADFVFALAAPSSLWGEKDWPLRDEKAVAAELEKLRPLVKALAPRALVFRTPPAIRPGSVGLKRFLALVEDVKSWAPIRVWEPAGVWQRDDALAVATPVGLVVTSDPLHDEIESEPVVYARMRGLGSDRRYHAGRLEDLADLLQTAQESFVVFANDQAFRDATRFLAVLEGVEVEADDEDADEELEDGAEQDGLDEDGDLDEDEDEDDGDDDDDEDDDDA